MHRPVIGYTLGDQAGIGPEIMRAALAAMEGEQAVFRPMGPAIAATPGRPTQETAQAAFDQQEAAATPQKEGRIDAVVTDLFTRKACAAWASTSPGRPNSLPTASA